jgi:phosphate transport system substrate-binding protein
MRATIKTLVSLTILATGCGSDGGNPNSVHLSVKGSDTLLPITLLAAESFMNNDANAAISVVGGGSGTGITALIDGTTDIAMSSREIELSEKFRAKNKGLEYREVVIGFDALAVVTNPSNPVNQLTREQIEQIFTGEIKNWKEVGGADAPIVAYSRESSSGTYEFFKEHVMDKKNYATTVLNMPATGAIVQSVSQTKGAIGYVGLAYLTDGVKALAVSYDQGKTFVAPSVQGAKDKSYPIARAMYYFYDAKNEAKVKSFVDYVMSDAGQKNVGDAGYVPVK